MAEPLTEPVTEDDADRLSLYPLSFEEALQAVLAVDPRKADIEEASDDGSGS